MSHILKHFEKQGVKIEYICVMSRTFSWVGA